ncbi:TIGR04150 pseudo-rSAM protein [uncultured Draconibacterium sp.]|uniref:TIGR04150 pseudo-rSAM protein n=2 Tax=Draconibacterium TaxID=1471399 RepID=UPI0029C8C08B|nr:TIGR04150 pseudo-rSAM protein [uncultured Draconibacterium sp.]
MKKKWIYIEPFVFIWQDCEYYIFYNCLNGQKVFYPINNTIRSIVQALCNDNSQYCVNLNEEVENSEEIKNLITVLIENQLGNIVSCSESDRPVNIPPKLMLDLPKDTKGENENYDPKILDNINELNIQLSGNCNLDCNYCGDYNLQFIHCSKSVYSLSESSIKQMIKQINQLKVSKINLTGGDILSLENYETIVDSFNSINAFKIYNTHLKQIKYKKIKYLLDKDKTSIVRISVHCGDSNKKDLMNQIIKLKKFEPRILWSFIVTSEKSLGFCYSVLEECPSIQSEIRPFFNKKNEKFIREFVFLDETDFTDINPTKKQIFANQVINKNYFGKITIHADGLLYDNVNFGVAGNINECLEDIIHKIIREDNSWKWIRNNDVCNNCLYRLICPPPSNLELVMDSKTICQRPRSYDSVLKSHPEPTN